MHTIAVSHNGGVPREIEGQGQVTFLAAKPQHTPIMNPNDIWAGTPDIMILTRETEA